MGAAEPFAVVPDRRKSRAGDDGELAGGSGISHANAAADTAAGRPASAGRCDDGRPKARHPKALDPKARYAKGGGRSSPDGFTADSAGSAAAVAERAEANGGGPKLNAGESSPRDCSAALLAGVSRSGSASIGVAAARCPYGVGRQRGHAVRDGGVRAPGGPRP